MAEKLKTSFFNTTSRVESSFKQIPVELLESEREVSGCESDLILIRGDVGRLNAKLSALAQLSFDRLKPLAKPLRMFSVEASGFCESLGKARQRCLEFKELVQSSVGAAAEVKTRHQDMMGDLDEALQSVARIRGLMAREQAPQGCLGEFVANLREFSRACREALPALQTGLKALTLSYVKIVGASDADQRAGPARDEPDRLRGAPGGPVAAGSHFSIHANNYQLNSNYLFALWLGGGFGWCRGLRWLGWDGGCGGLGRSWGGLGWGSLRGRGGLGRSRGGLGWDWDRDRGGWLGFGGGGGLPGLSGREQSGDVLLVDLGVLLGAGLSLGSSQSLSPSPVGGDESLDLRSLVVGLVALGLEGWPLDDISGDVEPVDLDLLSVLLVFADVVGVSGQAEELSDLVGSLWAESSWVLDVGQAGDFGLALGDDGAVDGSDVSIDDASSNTSSLSLALSAGSETAGSRGDEESGSGLPQDTVLHREAVLVGAAGDSQNVSLVTLTQDLFCFELAADFEVDDVSPLVLVINLVGFVQTVISEGDYELHSGWKIY